MLYFKMPCIFIKMAKIWHHIITNPSQRNPFLCSSLRKTYWVTMRKVRSLKSSCLFWERRFSCKDSRGKVCWQCEEVTQEMWKITWFLLSSLFFSALEEDWMCVMVRQEVKQSTLPFVGEKSCFMSQLNCLTQRVTHSRSSTASSSVCLCWWFTGESLWGYYV